MDIEEIVGGVPGSSRENTSIFFNRFGHATRRTWRVEDVLPDRLGVMQDDEPPEPREPLQLLSSVPPRRVTLLFGKRVRTATNWFGIRRFFKRKPDTRLSCEPLDLTARYGPTAGMATPTQCTLHEIISPFPNLSTWLLGHHFWASGNKMTEGTQRNMTSLLLRQDFNRQDLDGYDLPTLAQRLATGEGTAPWDIPLDN
jgi:hypothetical protein